MFIDVSKVSFVGSLKGDGWAFGFTIVVDGFERRLEYSDKNRAQDIREEFVKKLMDKKD